VAYGLGAALVIIGALFKLQHWTGAGIMLTIGMMTEFVIFTLSALESMPKKYSWENVYPELELTSGQAKTVNRPARTNGFNQQLDLNIDTMQVAGIQDGLSRLNESLKGLNSLAAVSQGSQQLAATLINANQAVSNVAHTSNALSETHVATAKIVSNYANETQRGIENSQRAMSVYGTHINTLNQNIGAINSSVETQMATLNKAIGTVNTSVEMQMGTLNKTIGAANSVISSSVETQMATLNKTVSAANSTVNSAIEAQMSGLSKTVGAVHSSIETQLATVNKTIGAVNSSFELQLNNLNKTIGNVTTSFESQLKDNQQYQQSYGLLNKEVVSLISDVKKSVQSSTELSTQMKSLTENVSRLNSVYGNMLTAITNLR
jgi:gliding motility-associated protein GldL